MLNREQLKISWPNSQRKILLFLATLSLTAALLIDHRRPVFEPGPLPSEEWISQIGGPEALRSSFRNPLSLSISER